MQSDTVHSRSAAMPPWLANLRLVAAVALVYALLYLLLNNLVLPRGLNRAPVLMAGAAPWSAPPLLLAVLLLGAGLGVVISGCVNPRGAVRVVCGALAIWAFFGGTMDHWLTHCNVRAEPPTGRPYTLLIADYVLLLLAIGGAVAIGAAAQRRGSVAGALKLREFSRQWPVGLGTLVIAGVAATAIMFVLMGPAESETHRLQVYFAVFVAFAIAPLAARHVLGDAHPLWLWLTPFVVGLVGVLVASAAPALMLPTRYAHLNSIPAWWLARPLPVEMICIGLLAIIWSSGDARAQVGRR